MLRRAIPHARLLARPPPSFPSRVLLRTQLTPSLSASSLALRTLSTRAVRRASSSSSPVPHGSHDPYPQDLPPNASLSQRLKHLIKSYGWYALGVYILVGVVDFGVSFAAINLLGADKVSYWASEAKRIIASFIPSTPSTPASESSESTSVADHEPSQDGEKSVKAGNEGLYAMLVLAYTVHKTVFLPFRVGVTAAFTPGLVKWLSRRGWAGSAGTKRAVQHAKDRYDVSQDMRRERRRVNKARSS